MKNLISLIVAFFVFISTSCLSLDRNSFNRLLNHPEQLPDDSLDIIMNQFTYMNTDTAVAILKYLDSKIGSRENVLKINVQTYLSGVYSKLNNENDFKYYNDIAISNAQKFDLHSLLTKAYIVRAEHYKAQYQLDSVIYYCLKAELSANQAKQFDLGVIYHTLGDVYYNLEIYDIAQKYYLDVIKHSSSKAFWNEWRKIVIFTNLGDINTFSGEFPTAFRYYIGALDQINQNKQSYADYNEHIQIAHLYNRMASMFRSWNKLDSAKLYIDLAIQNLQKEPALQYIYRYIFITAGTIYSDLNYYSPAEAFLLDAERELKEQSLGKEYECYHALALNYSKMGDYRKAADYYQKYDIAYRNYWRRNNSATILQQKVLADISKADNQMRIEIIQQRVYLGIIVCLAFLLLIVLYYQNKLRKSYRELVNKTINIIQNNETQHKNKTIQSGSNNCLINAENLNIDSEAATNHDEAVTSKVIENLNADLVRLAKKIDETLANNPIIYNEEFNINDLSQLVGSNRDYVSKAINGYFKVSFQFYINDLRVIAAIKLMQANPGNNFTMEYFMSKVGFNNRATFSKSFKRYTGLTPAVFNKTLNNDN